MQQNKLKIWLPLLISFSMAIGMFLGYKIRDNFPQKNFFERDQIGLLAEVSQLIKDKYMDAVSIDSLQQETIDNLLSRLDPHSQYISPAELEDINNSIEGRFFGIGVEYEIFRDSVFIIRILDKSPAQKSGLQSGDIILKAGNKLLSVKGVDSDSVRNAIRGEQGSDITLTVMRNGKQMTVKVTRDIVPINSIDINYRINDTTGYIHIASFTTQTHREFMQTLQDLQQKPLKKLILDLRDNGGGVLVEAVEIADEFLDGDKLITYTEGKHSLRKEYRCRRKGQFEEGKLVVLCNEESASASEILMGALQDWDRAKIIGNPSFGKGLVQEQYDLSNGGAIRLSIARYFTPLGRSIQRSYKNGEDAYFKDASQHNRPNDSASLKHPFITRAGKKLFGSNGITPDVILYSDTATMDSAFYSISEKKILSETAFSFFLKYKKVLADVKSSSVGFNQLNLQDSLQHIFINLCKKNAVDPKKMSAANQALAIKIIKNYVASYAWGQAAYFEIQNADDPVFVRAIGE